MINFFSRLSILLCLSLLLTAASEVTEKYIVDTPENMAYIEEGFFNMGEKSGDLTAPANSKPAHSVFLKPYYMDRLEVTIQEYKKCVSAGKCAAPAADDIQNIPNYYSSELYGRFPVTNITWQDAADYCAYAGKRLPTEAEWEKAGRGALDYRRYSWGNATPQEYQANLTLSLPEIGNSRPYGNSPYAISDMTANVSEWTADWFAADYYSVSPAENPEGPKNGTLKTIRGNSFLSAKEDLHIAFRSGADPNFFSSDLGFRCAKDVKERVYYDQPAEKKEKEIIRTATVNSGNAGGLFLLSEPGGANQALICVMPNGSPVEILEGPTEIIYTKWYRVRTSYGKEGWTIGSSLDINP